jgi:hypothetical protein
MNHQTDNGMILNKINPKPDKKAPVQKGILTTTMTAQGDTGANCSATDTIDIIHNYVEFETPQEVGVFSDDKTGGAFRVDLRTYFTKCNEMDRPWKIIIFLTHLFNARKASLASRVPSFYSNFNSK